MYQNDTVKLGHFGVEILDPATAPKGPKFVTITHLPTGLGMPKMVSPSDAKEIARTFEHFAAERGIDLDITTPPKNSQPMRELFDDILEGRVEMPKKNKAPPTMKTWSGERQIYKEQAEAALKELESTGDIDFERDFDMALSRERDRIGKEVEAAKRTERDEADAASRAGQPPPKVKAPNEWYALKNEK